ncbi:hypothetical protein ACHAW6_008345 [Cyclotella cf. meneghiniana]
MNGIKASSSVGHIPLMLTFTLASFTADPLIEKGGDSVEDDDDDETSLDDLPGIDKFDPAGENSNNPARLASCGGTSEVATASDDGDRFGDICSDSVVVSQAYRDKEESTTLRRVQDFLEPYIREKERLQPISVLQERYAALQHEESKQSQIKSVKPWFRYEQRLGDCKDLWWVSVVSVPPDVAKNWGFDLSGKMSLEISSKYRALCLNEWKILEEANHRKDLLLDIFGKYKLLPETPSNENTTETIWFKTKTAAQKNAALNLLILINNQETATAQFGTTLRNTVTTQALARKQFPKWVDRLFDLGFGSQESKQRFKLQNIKYRAALSNPLASNLRSDNPCFITCAVSYFDSMCECSNEIITAKSSGHFSREESLEDVLNSLEVSIDKLSCGPSENEVSEKEFILMSHHNSIYAEVSLPLWSTCSIGSQVFLYELKFYLSDSATGEETGLGNTEKLVPFSEACGLGTSSTRIGLVLGRDIFEEYLSAEITLPGQKNITSTSRLLSVTMCNRTCVNISDLTAQIEEGSDELDLLSLMKCFNSILFENGGRTYGMSKPKRPIEILSQLDCLNTSECDRTYFFLPLLPMSRDVSPTPDGPELRIDWKIVFETVNGITTPALRQFNINPKYCLGLTCMLLVSVLVELIICMWAYNGRRSQEVEENHLSHRHTCVFVEGMVPTLATKRGLIYVVLLIVYFTVFIVDKVPPRRIPTAILFNRFIKQPLGFKSLVFVLDRREPNISLTSLSSLLPAGMISAFPTELKRSFYERFKLHLDTATYASYYQKVSGSKLKYQNERLIKACHVRCHAEHDFTVLGNLCDDDNISSRRVSQAHIKELLVARGYLVPEYVSLEPMPRDLLYLCQHSSHFMTALERSFLLRVVARRLLHLQTKARNLLECEHDAKTSFSTLISLISQATAENNSHKTTASVREYERLESLGDLVLMFLITVNMFASCANQNEYVLDMFRIVIQSQGRNSVLSKGALLLGLHSLSYDRAKSIASWKSAYATNNLSSCGTETAVVKRLSNLFESLLGASYVSDSSGAMSVGILNEISSCFKGRNAPDASPHWFTAKSTCLNAGYHFKNDLMWDTELSRVRETLLKESLVMSTLKSGADELFNQLLKHSGRHDLIHKMRSFPQNNSTLLIYAALFDDSLDESGIDENDGDTKITRLKVLSILRDKMFHVGHSALLLNLAEEIYHHYPTATSGDIHFSKIYVLSDDTLAYILVKNEIHKCLFDKADHKTLQFASYMRLADSIGEEFCAKHDGWIISGGIHEFRRRVKLMNNRIINIDVPRYVGLAAGRLFGRKNYVPKDVTENLVFSMKTIMGALCLSVGLKDAWILLRPIFLELFLLSPDETRRAFVNMSDLAAKCVKGKR